MPPYLEGNLRLKTVDFGPRIGPESRDRDRPQIPPEPLSRGRRSDVASLALLARDPLPHRALCFLPHVLSLGTRGGSPVVDLTGGVVDVRRRRQETPCGGRLRTNRWRVGARRSPGAVSHPLGFRVSLDARPVSPKQTANGNLGGEPLPSASSKAHRSAVRRSVVEARARHR